METEIALKTDSTFHLADQAQVKILMVPLDLFVDLLLTYYLSNMLFDIWNPAFFMWLKT